MAKASSVKEEIPSEEKPKKAIYRSLADEFRGYILKGHWDVGNTIPTEAELCQLFSASRSTIRKTLEHLTQEGYLERKAGKGTWVTDFKSNEEIWTVEDMSPFLPSPTLVKAEILSWETLAKDSGDSILSAFKDTDLIIRIKAVRRLENTPLQLVHVHLRKEDANVVLNNFNPESDIFFYKVLERITGKTIYTVQDSYEAVLAVGETAEVLHIAAGSPLIMVTRTLLDAEGRILIVTRLFMRTDIQKIKTVRRKSIIR